MAERTREAADMGWLCKTVLGVGCGAMLAIVGWQLNDSFSIGHLQTEHENAEKERARLGASIKETTDKFTIISEKISTMAAILTEVASRPTPSPAQHALNQTLAERLKVIEDKLEQMGRRLDRWLMQYRPLPEDH